MVNILVVKVADMNGSQKTGLSFSPEEPTSPAVNKGDSQGNSSPGSQPHLTVELWVHQT